MGGRAGVECPPDTSHWEISADLPGKERVGKTGKWRRKEEKSRKRKWKIENGRRKSDKMRRGFFFFFFFAFHFSKPVKFVLGQPKWKFSNRKNHFSPGKNSGKMILTPLKNIPFTPLRSACDKRGVSTCFCMCMLSGITFTCG